MITLENEFLRVSISDGRGARIEEFFDKKKNKNWVWKPSEIKNASSSLSLEEGFDDNWAGGWEEVFPNDAPTDIDNYKLVDHGEVWRRTWEMDGRRKNNEVSFYIRCETYPMVLRKTYVLNEKKLSIQFEVESLASRPLPYILKFHPAILMEEGDEFDIPNSDVKEVAPGFGTIDKKGPVLKAIPQDGKSREFLCFGHFLEGRCGIKSLKTGSHLHFEFSKNDFPFLWLFQSFGGFMNHYVTMIEPVNADHYDLRELSKEGRSQIIAPESKRTHKLLLRVE